MAGLFFKYTLPLAMFTYYVYRTFPIMDGDLPTSIRNFRKGYYPNNNVVLCF
jgi:hypothetical protein